MEITLEKIELVKDRTGVTYKEAKEALEAADGSVVDAIINIEESVDFEDVTQKAAGKEIIDQIKKTIAKGHMSKLIVKKGDEVILNLPLTVGVLGAIVAPWGAIVAIIAAAGTKCTVEFVNDKGETTDINGKVMDKYSMVKERGQAAYGKSQESFDKIRDTKYYNDFKAKGEETLDRIKESELYNDIKAKSNDVVAEIKNIKEEGFDNQKVKDSLEELVKKGEAGLEELRKKSEEIDLDALKKKGEAGLEELKKRGEEIFKRDNAEEAFLYEFEDDNVEMTFGGEGQEEAVFTGDNVVDAFADAVADVTGGHTTLEETVDALAANDDVSSDEIEDLAKILDEVEKASGLMED